MLLKSQIIDKQTLLEELLFSLTDMRKTWLHKMKRKMHHKKTHMLFQYTVGVCVRQIAAGIFISNQIDIFKTN